MWKDQWNTGIAAIDEEHKQLFELYTTFSDQWEKGFGPHVIDLLDKLIKYTKNHFSNEEKLMKDHDCPFLKEHKKIHKQMEKEVLDFKKRVSTESDKEVLSAEIGRFLDKWLIAHIGEHDKMYVPYILIK